MTTQPKSGRGGARPGAGRPGRTDNRRLYQLSVALLGDEFSDIVMALTTDQRREALLAKVNSLKAAETPHETV